MRTFDTSSLTRYPVRRKLATLYRWAAIATAIRWADVVHWHFDGQTMPAELDLRLAARLRKGRIVEFWGSDIRIPEIAVVDNPYLARLLAAPDADYNISYRRSRGNQERFARHGFACLAPGPEMPAYVQCDLFPSYYHAEAALNLEEFEPSYPDPAQRRPIVVHAPSNLAVKGTAAVLAAVEQLKGRCAFEFRLVHDVPRAQALAMMRDADVMLDQFVIGSFGSAALEAMALGKPAVCYLTPSVVANLPPGAPFVNAGQDDLVEVLAGLLGDGDRRHTIGCQSREYVEQHHDAQAVARRLAAVYEELMERQRQG